MYELYFLFDFFCSPEWVECSNLHPPSAKFFGCCTVETANISTDHLESEKTELNHT